MYAKQLREQMGRNAVLMQAAFDKAKEINPATNKKLAKALSLAVYRVLDGVCGSGG